MEGCSPLSVCFLAMIIMAMAVGVRSEDPYVRVNWTVTMGTVYPLGIPQQVIMINNQFPGPPVNVTTNDNLVVTISNKLGEPFLMAWNGVFHRRNSFITGMAGDTCPIPSGSSQTYIIHMKDQIGTFFYFPSLGMQKAAGGFGGLTITPRIVIAVPFPNPDADFTLLIGDWYKQNHKELKAILESGHELSDPDGLLINGQPSGGSVLTVQKGGTYRIRISNVGIQSSFEIRIQNHTMKLVEAEGTYTEQTDYPWLHVHVGQSLSVLVTTNQPSRDYLIAVSTIFSPSNFTTTAVLHYNNSALPALPFVPLVHDGTEFSMTQELSIRTNLSASGPRPNPQGSYHYGEIKVTRNIYLLASAGIVNGKQRYAVNGVSFKGKGTPLKLADYFRINGIFVVGSLPDRPLHLGKISENTSVLGAEHRTFVEFVIQNDDSAIQSWHLDGYNFFVVGMGKGNWNKNRIRDYNLHDAISRSTVQVYPYSWSAFRVSLDNVGMWNVRSQIWARRFLGEQFYLKVYTNDIHVSTRDESRIPNNTILCGKARGMKINDTGYPAV